MQWFTSDWHLGHTNILRFCARPFRDIEAMNNSIVNTMNDHAGPQDELWILGDLALGKIETTLAVTKQLTAGKVILVAGNHDRCHPAGQHGNHDKATQWAQRYLELARLDEVHLNNTVHIAGHDVAVNHFPYAGQDARAGTAADGSPIADRFAAWRPQPSSQWLLCGHVHQGWQQHGNMINVGVDAWAGQPVSAETISQLIGNGPRHTHADPWTGPRDK